MKKIIMRLRKFQALETEIKFDIKHPLGFLQNTVLVYRQFLTSLQLQNK